MPSRPDKISLIGVPSDLGANKLGAGQGPEAIRRTELAKDVEKLGFAIFDRGNVPVPERPSSPGNPRKKYLASITKICGALEGEVFSAHKAGTLPVVLGGDHSLAMGSVAGSSRFYAQKKKSMGLLWIDAHGDMNTPETSATGNIHGMPLAHLLGMGDKKLMALGGPGPKVQAKNVCLVGIRSIDDEEKKNLRDSGVHIFTMKDIDRHGMAGVVEQALERAGSGTAGIHVSFDVDAIDPAIAQGTSSPSRGGLTYRESHLLMELVSDSGLLCSLDMVEVNPLEDVHNHTAELAAELILSALGKRIY